MIAKLILFLLFCFSSKFLFSHMTKLLRCASPTSGWHIYLLTPHWNCKWRRYGRVETRSHMLAGSCLRCVNTNIFTLALHLILAHSWLRTRFKYEGSRRTSFSQRWRRYDVHVRSTSCSNRSDCLQHLWTHLMERPSCCLLQVWIDRCGETPDLILWRSSGEHLWKGLILPLTAGDWQSIGAISH